MTSISLTERTAALPSGETVPRFGLGTWRMGETRRERNDEIAIIREAIDLGIRLIDTAEMYGEGGAEDAVGEAIKGRRDTLFIVTKVFPHNASHNGVVAACERSLKRLGTDRIDLYLLHWPGSVPIAETLGAFVALQEAGKIRHYGVSNFDADDLEEAWGAAHGPGIAANQLLYNLSRRGIEHDTLPWMRERGIPLMAYSPLEQARLLQSRALRDFAQRHDMTPAQAALRWLLTIEDVIVIPKTVRRERLVENIAALDRDLTQEQRDELGTLFPPPANRTPLAVL